MTNTSSPYIKATTVPLTVVACIYCAIVFVVLNLAGNHGSWEVVEHWGYFPDEVIWQGKPWALITSVFVHIDWMHCAFNLYWLWILGSCFEETLGSRRWLVFFLGAAWVSSSAELLLGGNSGIGMSGVGYALFGFGWIARKKLPPFAHIVDDRTVKIFLAWLVFCVVLTQLGMMQIANWAHVFGLAFGVAVAALFVLRWRPWIPAISLCALAAISFIPLHWCPLSGDWTSLQATQAVDRNDFGTAVYWYQRSLDLGQDPVWVWSNLALAYGYQNKKPEYKKAIQELQKIDKGAAKDVEKDYGVPPSTDP